MRSERFGGEEFEAAHPSEIEVPSNEAAIRSLRLKLAEYAARLAMDSLSVGPYDSPELIARRNADSLYKYTILASVLNTGRANREGLKAELSSRGAEFSEEDFFNAWRVIEDYCRTGGKSNDGGTGLSE